jgi:ParB family transcriptional regulator, chromosome partitioning protein
MKARIENIKVVDRYRKEFGSIENLASSIKELGLLHPPIIDSNYRLIDGERRIKAHMLLGLDEVEVRIVHVPNLLKAEYDANNEALPWTVSEKVALGRAIEEELKGRVGRPKTEIRQNFGELPKGKTDAIASQKVGLGNAETYRQAKKVVDNAEPELIEAMDSGDIAVSTAAALTELPVKTQVYAAENPKEAPAIVHNHRAQGTGENEWYTPEQHIASASQVLGGIALDPATSELANKVVKADTIFTQEDNGLEQPWHGTVWLNPPYSQPAISQFAEKLASEWESGRLTAAIALTHNYTDTQWFHRLAKACTAICFTKGRIGFVNPEGKKAAPTQGQSFFYFGDKPEDFADEFSKHGFVVEVCRGV